MVDMETEGDCWLWLGANNRGGYGTFSVGGKTYTAHRVSWLISNHYIPNDLCVCHSCDNRLCVNPDHLWLGTKMENYLDMIAKHRRANNCCARGMRHWNHKLTPSDIEDIRTKYASGKMSQRELAQEYNVGQSHVSAIIRQARWRPIDAIQGAI